MRFAKVIVMLLALAASAGAVVGVIFMIATALIGAGDLHGITAEVLGYAAAFGAAVGGITGPPIALLFLRRVPLWRATLETAAAAGLGAAAGSLFPIPFGWLYGTVAVAILASLRLRRAFATRREASAPLVNKEL